MAGEKCGKIAGLSQPEIIRKGRRRKKALVLKKRMCPRAKAEIRRPLPIAQVVATFKAVLGIVADFIWVKTGRLQNLSYRKLHFGLAVLIRKRQGFAQPVKRGALLHAQSVSRKVGKRQGRKFLQRLPETLFGLVGNSEHDIGRKIGKTNFRRAPDGCCCLGGRVAAPQCAQFGIRKALHADAQAVHARRQKGA